jgi:hypothetical protein
VAVLGLADDFYRRLSFHVRFNRATAYGFLLVVAGNAWRIRAGTQNIDAFINDQRLEVINLALILIIALIVLFAIMHPVVRSVARHT